VIGRSMDAVDPKLTAQVRDTAAAVPQVQAVEDVHLRWAGRALFVSLAIALPSDLTLGQAHETAEAVRHELLHEIENLREVDVHMDPAGDYALAHATTAHHEDDGAHADDHEHDHDDHNGHHEHEHEHEHAVEPHAHGD